MRKIVAFVSVVLAVTAFGAAMAPVVPMRDNHAGRYYSHTPQTTTLGVQASACTTVGDTDCTSILDSTDILTWGDCVLWIKNTGGTNVITDVLVEISPDGTNWLILDSTTFAGLATGTMKHLSLAELAIKNIRVNSRSASGTTVSVFLTGRAP